MGCQNVCVLMWLSPCVYGLAWESVWMLYAHSLILLWNSRKCLLACHSRKYQLIMVVQSHYRATGHYSFQIDSIHYSVGTWTCCNNWEIIILCLHSRSSSSFNLIDVCSFSFQYSLQVNYKLSRDFESNCKGRYKQISAPANMLTKDLYFFPKQEWEYFT